MTDRMRARRWPWVLACVVLFCTGVFGGLLLTSAAMVHMFNVPCPPVFRPTPSEMEAATRGPGVFPPHALTRPGQMPVAGRMAKVRGQVMVLARVEADGSVSRTELINSSGFCPFDIEALKDVRLWKFEPAHRFGQAFAAWAPETVIFSQSPPPRPTPAKREGENI